MSVPRQGETWHPQDTCRIEHYSLVGLKPARSVEQLWQSGALTVRLEQPLLVVDDMGSATHIE